MNSLGKGVDMTQKMNCRTSLEAIRKITGELTSTLDVSEVLDHIVRLTAEAMMVKGAALRLLDKNSREFRLSGAWGLSGDYLFKGPLAADYSIADCLRGKIVHIPDVQSDPQIQYPEDAEAEGIVSILSVPMILRERVIGVLRIYSADPRTYSKEDLEFVQMLADLGTLALEHARLYSGLKEAHDSLIEDFHNWFETSTYPPANLPEPAELQRCQLPSSHGYLRPGGASFDGGKYYG